MDTPHVLLAGEGALLFARRHALAQGVKPTEEVRERHRKLVASFKSQDRKGIRPEWQIFGLSEQWNFPSPMENAWMCDTVGAVALDQKGRFAVANSTGGASPMLFGRVGDSPLPGCGFWCGPEGGVVATGIGEYIIRRMLSREVYDEIRKGEDPQGAAESSVRSFPQDVPIGVIAISSRGIAVTANREMAFWKQIHE
jgi:L-asparaginase/beta-aspartyl-peptidase (threonine type)